MGKFTARRLALDGVLVAIYFVLATYCSIPIGNQYNITLQALPVIICAFLFTPLDTIVVSTMGDLLYQVVRFGLSSTTVMWLVPHLIFACILSIYVYFRKEKMGKVESIIVIILANLILTLLNMLVSYIDGLIWGYSVAVLVTMPIKLLLSIATAIALGFVSMPIVKALSNVVKKKV